MGIDASYAISYKKGLLKKIQEEIKTNQYYYCQWMNITYKLIRNYDDEKIRFDLRSNYCDSSIYFYPHLGLLEIDDGRRYFGLENEEYNESVITYFKNLFETMGVDSDCYIHMDCYGSISEETEFNSIADKLTYIEFLQEIPSELLTEHEKNILESIDKPVS